MKYCKDCAWIEISSGTLGQDFSKCLHPDVQSKPTTSSVTGKHIPCESPYAEHMRTFHDAKCGPDAKLFTPNDAYAEHLRDKKIDGNEEARRERAESRYRDSEQEFESEQGARP